MGGLAATSARVSFSDADIEAFAAASHDRSPLHCDPDYARTTQFGRPVVHGVAAIVRALGLWSAGRPFRIETLDARFRRPLFPGITYRLEIADEAGRAVLRYFRGAAVQLEIEIAARPSERITRPPQGAASPALAASAFTLPESDAPVPLADDPYVPDLGGADLLGLDPALLPPIQLAAILWSSYYVGMKVPGRQALFTELSLRTNDERADTFVARDLRLTVDRRFGMLTVEGRGTGLETLRLRAFVRPPPVRYADDEIEAAAGRSGEWAGRVALVTGSGRGSGAVLVAALALRGARVVTNARTAGDAQHVAERIRGSGGDAHAIAADVSDEAGCARLAEGIAERYGALDLLVNSASPAIAAQGFLEQSPADLLGFLTASVGAYARPTHALLPLMRPGGLVVSITSSYLVRPRPQLSHYLAAKGAIEALMRGIALEAPHLRVVVVRAPRMLTDQTNVPVDMEPKVRAPNVARGLLDRLATLEGAGFHTIDLPDPRADGR